MAGYTAAICTLGCKVNAYESETMARALQEAGCRIVPFDGPADFYIVNTCTVTLTAQKKSRQFLRRARSQSGSSKVIACGCYSETGQDLPFCDLMLSNQDKMQLVPILVGKFHLEPREDGTAAALSSRPHAGTSHKTRADLKIQDGCRQFCTYCLIPYVRGPLRSRPVSECVQEAQELIRNGCREIVLTGIHLSSYGLDFDGLVYRSEKGLEKAGKPLLDLIEQIDASGCERIRLGSLEPTIFTDEFVTRLSRIPSVCPQFHLALQSGCARTLKAMNRMYTPDSFAQAAMRLRDAFPGCALTTDLIVGFPGETEEDHRESMAFVKEIGFAQAHVFRYSPMPGTAAARMKDQVPPSVKRRRSDEMLSVCADSSRRYLEQMQQKIYPVLLESFDPETGLFIGCCPNYMKTAVSWPEGGCGHEMAEGSIVMVKINGYAPLKTTNHEAEGLDYILRGDCQ